MGEMARQLADRLLSALSRAEQLFPAALSATGDVPEAPSASQPEEEDQT